VRFRAPLTYLQSVLFYFAPTSKLEYKHPSTIASLKALHEFGNTIIPAESGELASGLSGEEEWQNLQLFLVLEADLR
jgi:phosphopantothenoylcysteine decarboxylase/phosphopantothenate--cysteine ligase